MHLYSFEFFSKVQDSDYIKVYDGNSDESLEIKMLTASSDVNEMQLISSGNTMFVTFQTNTFGVSNGFLGSIQWIADCGNSLDLIAGQLMSPNFPGPYENNIQCNWLIAAPNNMIVILEIFSFDVSIAVFL